MKANKLIGWIGLLSLVLFSCGEKDRSLSVFAYADDDTFILSLFESLKDDLDGYKTSFYYAKRNQNEQNRAIISSLDQGTDALLINLVDRMAASAIIEKSYLYDVPCIFLNRKPLEEDLDPTSGGEYASWVKEKCFYVGSYPSYEGRLQAGIANDFFEAEGGFAGSRFDRNHDGILQVCLLKGEQGHQDAEERSLSSLSTLQEQGYQVDLVASLSCDWERSIALDKASSLPLGKIELVISNNDDMALGLIDYLEGEDYGEGPLFDAYFPIVGVDGTAEGMEAVREGKMIGTVLNDNVAQSRCAASLVDFLLNRGNMPVGGDGIYQNENYFYVQGEAIKSALWEKSGEA